MEMEGREEEEENCGDRRESVHSAFYWLVTSYIKAYISQ